jgi:uncharacterized protein
MGAQMDFEWDENKRISNLKKHGVDFIDAAALFENWHISNVSGSIDYGEVRLKALGLVDGEILCVIYTLRGERYRLISAHTAGKNDRRKYRELYARRDQSNEGER